MRHVLASSTSCFVLHVVAVPPPFDSVQAFEMPVSRDELSWLKEPSTHSQEVMQLAGRMMKVDKNAQLAAPDVLAVIARACKEIASEPPAHLPYRQKVCTTSRAKWRELHAVPPTPGVGLSELSASDLEWCRSSMENELHHQRQTDPQSELTFVRRMANTLTTPFVASGFSVTGYVAFRFPSSCDAVRHCVLMCCILQ